MEETKAGNEFEQMKPRLAEAKLGSFLIVPLKYDQSCRDFSWLRENAERQKLETMDLNELVKKMFNESDSIEVGACYQITKETFIRELLGKKSAEISGFAAVEGMDSEINWELMGFDVNCAYFYLFHTGIAFLCLGIRYSDMRTLRRIRNPGYAEESTAYYYLNKDGTYCRFSLSEQLTGLYRKAGMEMFFGNGKPLFLEAFTYNFAVVTQRFEHMETMRRITFNLHRMTDICEQLEDDSEADVRYVYAVKDQRARSYRWGCCASSQTLSYVVADPEQDIETEMEAQAQDGMPMVLLALYEKYTCLHFTELLSLVDKKKVKRIKSLKKMMLEFQAYGMIHPANISRWHNVKMIYQYLLETNALQEAVEDVDRKISILNEHQREIETARSETVMGVITVFGVVSILASVLSIIQILSGGNELEWMVTILTSLTMVMIAVIAFMWERKK